MEDERSVSPWSVRADGCITGSMVSMVILSDSSVYLSRKFDSISLIESVSAITVMVTSVSRFFIRSRLVSEISYTVNSS
ncbi:MAG: hypothetical protein MR389_09965 [Clostridiales bacterium]|nr:hypothetical protein [Clostridiales bacterium]